jgi:hypothetical protein
MLNKETSPSSTLATLWFFLHNCVVIGLCLFIFESSCILVILGLGFRFFVLVVLLHSGGGHKHGKICQNLFLNDHNHTYTINIKKK